MTRSQMQTSSSTGTRPDPVSLRARLGNGSLSLVGMMGAGKSSVGRRLAARLGIAFVDADAEIETAAGMTIAEIFQIHGEPHFRDGERKVIARLLENGPQVLATGGGAWMNEETRAAIARHGVSIWLKADPEILIRRVKRRNDRPLLAGPNSDAKLRALVEERYPVYGLADVTVHSREVSHEVVVEEILAALSGLPRLGPEEDDAR